MQSLTANQLDVGTNWQPSSPRLTRELDRDWQAIHYAAQALVEIGKRWGDPAADDSHSAMRWDPGHRALVIEGAGDRGPIRGSLKMRTLSLHLRGAGGSTEELCLDGLSLAEAMEWTNAASGRLAGPPRHASVPAPDLPDHPIATGESFRLSEPRGAAIEALYHATAHTLSRLASIAPAFGTARCWPHHFDLASLAVLRTGPSGEMQRTLGAGLTPPDAVEGSGYFYVSPWTADGLAASTPARLEHGHWLERPGALPMAVLGLAELSGVAEERQAGAVAAFLVNAINASVSELGGPAL